MKIPFRLKKITIIVRNAINFPHRCYKQEVPNGSKDKVN